MIKYQQGYSLPELLISLLLASMIMVILMHHYLNTKRQYLFFETAFERQMDIQLAADLIRDSIRKAGFTPCLGIDQHITLDQRDEFKTIRGFELGPQGQSWLRLNRMSEQFDTVLQVVSLTALLTSLTQPLYAGESILLADCFHAEIQTIDQVQRMVSSQKITLSKPMAFIYHEPIYIGEWLEETYFVRNGLKGQATLFYQNQHPEELTNAVHTLSVSVSKYDEHSVLHVVLGLDRAKQVELDTMIRTP